ncbi:hypothetical protein [Actinocorallia libanotica]|uniref:Lsr2 protein n=1 Tax=Actinocorallia libanotica TaxID=46162 RepID=A0ABN1RZZ0_9ACTN
MRHNGRPIILASRLNPADLDLREGWRPLVVCTDCHTWRVIKRSMVVPHRAEDGKSRCPGSAQRIRVDITVEDWRPKAIEAVRDAASRRGTKVLVRPKPSPPAAISQMSAARAREAELLRRYHQQRAATV